MQISITDNVTVMQVQVPGQMGPEGPQGIPGQANVLTIGGVTTLAPGSSAVATISGVSPNQTLNLSIPQGAKGDKGDTGATPTISSGTINTVQWSQPIVSTLTGTAPNYILNLSIPKGRGFTPRGAWAATTAYSADDLVTNGGNTYLCLTAHTSGTTFSGPGANWQLWASIGNTGPIGPANTLTIGTVTTGSTNTQAAVSITGTAPNQVLNLTLPAGPMGAPGATGPANTLAIGTVTTLATGSSATATITGTAPNQTLNLSIPQGAAGTNGTNGAAALMTIGSVTTLAAGASATASVTGTAPNYTLNLGIPQGAAGTSTDSTTTAKGIVQLAGDLGGTAAAPTVTGGTHHTHTSSQISDLMVPAPGSYVAVLTGLSTSGDNATAIQNAINTASTAGGGTVIVPAGTWPTTALTMKSRVRLVGTGWGSILQLASGSNAHMITLFDAQTEQTHIENLRLDGNKANQTGTFDVIHYDGTGFSASNPYPSLGDPNHYMRRVVITDASRHGVYVAGGLSQTQFDSVLSYTSAQNGFYVSSPDNQFINCIQAESGYDGFYIAGNSNRFVNCKSFLAGEVDATKGSGYYVASVSRIDLIGCEAQDNRQHGYSLNTTAQLNMAGCRADRNGLGANSAGYAGDGLYAYQVTVSRIELVSGDRYASSKYMQRWTYNCSSGNSGNVVTILAGTGADASKAGNGSFGSTSVGWVLWNGVTATGWNA